MSVSVRRERELWLGSRRLGYLWFCLLDVLWCGFCKVLVFEYSKAVVLLVVELVIVRLVKVDGYAESELTEEFFVIEYFTFKFFRDGDRLYSEEYIGAGRGYVGGGGSSWIYVEGVFYRFSGGRRYR